MEYAYKAMYVQTSSDILVWLGFPGGFYLSGCSLSAYYLRIKSLYYTVFAGGKVHCQWWDQLCSRVPGLQHYCMHQCPPAATVPGCKWCRGRCTNTWRKNLLNYFKSISEITDYNPNKIKMPVLGIWCHAILVAQWNYCYQVAKSATFGMMIPWDLTLILS